MSRYGLYEEELPYEMEVKSVSLPGSSWTLTRATPLYSDFGYMRAYSRDASSLVDTLPPEPYRGIKVDEWQEVQIPAITYKRDQLVWAAKPAFFKFLETTGCFVDTRQWKLIPQNIYYDRIWLDTNKSWANDQFWSDVKTHMSLMVNKIFKDSNYNLYEPSNGIPKNTVLEKALTVYSQILLNQMPHNSSKEQIAESEQDYRWLTSALAWYTSTPKQAATLYGKLRKHAGSGATTLKPTDYTVSSEYAALWS